uniref:Transcription factor 19 (SC1), like n=1 Tax=Neogobius melanostomus TaxID=47308 RepID=A0A8C6U9W4_9GOBI
MLSGVQPCFQLLRIGPSVGDSVRDLYTFRPALSQCVFRLGRAPELCDVTLDSASVSRIHAELQAQRETGAPHDEGWRVHVKDRSSHGTWVNEVRLQPGVQWELSDGDTLTFGDQSTPGSGEFYFLFQKVKVRPLDFDAITIPKVIVLFFDSKTSDNLDLSKLSLNRATVILNSIGSLSKMKGSAWTFKRSQSLEGTGSDHGCPASPPLAVGFTSLLPPPPRPPSPPPLRLPPPTSPCPRPRAAGGSRPTRCCWRTTARTSPGAAGAVEPCAAPRCKLPQQDTVQWIQCDVCDAWYHIDCLHIDRKKLLRDPNADFHCGCR